MYGLKNCDRCRAARRWLDSHSLRVDFFDVREQQPTARELTRWARQLGWRNLLNRRSRSWREVPPANKEDLDERGACSLMLAEPRLIKRPLLVRNTQLHVGFTPEHYAEIFGVNP